MKLRKYSIRKITLLAVVLVLTFMTLAGPTWAQDDMGGGRLCTSDDPIFTPLAEAERIDELTIMYENELGQQFVIQFDESMYENPDAQANFEEFIAEAQICFEGVPAAESAVKLISERRISLGSVVIDNEEQEYEVRLAIFEDENGISIGTDMPFAGILAQTLVDVTQIDTEELIQRRNESSVEDPGPTLGQLLEEYGYDPGEFIEEAAWRAIVDPDLINQMFAEMGFPDLSADMLFDEARSLYEAALNDPFLSFLPEDQVPVIQFVLDPSSLMEFMGDEEYVVHFAIDPTLWRGWSSSHSYGLNSSGWMRATVGTTQGCITGYIPSKWWNYKCAVASAYSGWQWAQTLKVIGWSSRNYYTLRGTWYRN